ncbi:MAG: outer membrane protein assembly factor BamB family protein [Candidatus Zipacnadales bacterium]
MRRSLVLSILSWIVLLAMAQTSTLAMSSYRYDSGNSGYAPESLSLPLTLLWKHSTELTEEPIIASPAVGDDAVYFAVQKKVYACDRLTGDVLWEFDTGTKVFSTLLFHEGRLYFGGADSNLWVLNAKTGHPEWKFKTDGPIDCPPLIVDNVLYIGSDDNRLHAIDLNTRQQRWTFTTEGDIKAAPAKYKGNLLVVSRDEHLYCIDKDGRQRWRVGLASDVNFAAPVVDAGRDLIYVTSGNTITCIDGVSRSTRWAPPFHAADLIVGSPALAPNRMLYVASKDGSIYGVNALDGRAVWKYPKESGVGIEPALSSPTVLENGIVLVRTGPKLLAGLSADKGELLWEYRLATPPEKKKTQATSVGVPGTEGGMMGPMGGGSMMGPMGGGMMGPPLGAEGGEMGLAPGGEEGRGRRRSRRADDTGLGGMGGLGGLRGGQETEPEKFEENLNASLIVAGGAVYVLGDDGALYAFDVVATDQAPPMVKGAILDITTPEKYRYIYALKVLGGDEPANREADVVEVPALPPLYLYFNVLDEGSGIDPSSVQLTMSGKKLDALYDSIGSRVWFILDPERGPAEPLPNGPQNFKLRLRDWHGNETIAQVSFTVNNAKKLEVPTAGMAGPMGGEGGMMGPMGGSMMGPMGGGMMGPMGGGMMGPMGEGTMSPMP